MSVYFVREKKKWRYDFMKKGQRYSECIFKSKKDAKRAEAKRREEVENPELQMVTEDPTDMGFFELTNFWLDNLKEYRSERHYQDAIYFAKRWCSNWKEVQCNEMTMEDIQKYLLKRKKDVSPISANKDLRLLRSLFNFGIKPPRKWIENNPTDGIEFFPVIKNEKYVPPKEDVLKVINLAEPDTQDYLWTIVCTMGRMTEINRLEWKDVNLEDKYLVLYTRKKKGGHLTPRRIPLNHMLFELLYK